MSVKSELSRSKILTAALAALEHDGVRALTLDKVAAKAEVSKGGLTHHFKSKQELLLGVFDLVVHTMRSRIDAFWEQEPDDGSPGRFTRAYLRANLECIQNGQAESTRALLEMLVAEPSIAGFRRAELLGLHARLESDGLPALQAMTLACASDGCWTDVLLGFCDPADPKIARLHAYLIALSRHPMPLPEVSQ
jgi:AcrR family transcriptional regulator